jgi:cytidylate kinase
MDKINLPNIRNITVSGRIGSGATTLAKKLSETLGWSVLDGGKLFRKINEELGMTITESNLRPDHFDLEYEEKIKKILNEESKHIIQSHLAGFDAQGIPGVFKILVLCVDSEGNDKTEIRIDRLVNRDGKSVEEAKKEVLDRETEHLKKFRRLYAKNDQDWVYWKDEYYDLVINSFSNNEEESLKIALEAIGFKN